MNKKIIGRLEKISLLNLELFDLDAKVDTGADSNSLHCDDIHVDENRNVHFKLLDDVHESYHGKKMLMPLYKMKKIKSSNGSIQSRATIKVQVSFFGKIYNSTVTLADRSDMKYPMLIGRNFLNKKFLVDVSKEYLSTQGR